MDDHQQQQALDEIDFNNMPDMPDMPDDIQPFDQTRGDESALDLLPPQDDLALDNTILGGEDSYQYMEEPSQNIEERDGQDIPEEDKYQSRVNVESSSSAAHPGDTSKIKDLFEFEDETSQQLQQQQQQTNEYGFSVSTVRTMKMLHSSFSENDGEELSYNEMTTSVNLMGKREIFLIIKRKSIRFFLTSLSLFLSSFIYLRLLVETLSSYFSNYWFSRPRI